MDVVHVMLALACVASYFLGCLRTNRHYAAAFTDLAAKVKKYAARYKELMAKFDVLVVESEERRVAYEKILADLKPTEE